MRGGFSLFYNMWLTVTLLYHTTSVTDDPLKLVFLGVVLEGTIFLFEIPTGVVADSYSRKWSTIVGLLLIGVAYFLEGSAPIYGRVLLAHFIYGLGFTFFSGANDAWLADEVGADNAAPIFVRGSQISLMMSQAGILSAIAIGRSGLNIPLLVAGVGIFALGMMLIVTMTENGFTPEETTGSVFNRMSHTFQNSINVLHYSPHLITVVIVGIVVGLSVGGYDRLFTPHFLSYDPPYEPVVWFGVLSAVVSLSSAIILEWIRKRAKLISVELVPRSIAVLYGGTILGNIVFVLAGHFWLAVVAFWFSQMLRTTTRPLIIVWINQIAESRVRATAISMYWQSNALGQILGSPMLGLIGRIFSLRVALMSAVLALSPTLWLLRRQKINLPNE